MMRLKMESLLSSLLILSLSLHTQAMIPHESCSLEWCGERELRLPSLLIVESCKLAEEVYKLEVLNKKLDYLQAACLDSRSSEKSCWTGSACSCNDCSSLLDCCISSQKCTTRVLRSGLGISFQRSLASLNGAITKCRLNTQKALMTGMTKEDADVGVLILEEIRVFNQYSPRAVLGNRTKSLISERMRKDLRPVILGDATKGEGRPLIVFSRKARDLLKLLEMVDGNPLSKTKEETSMVDGETGKDSTWVYRKEYEEEGKPEQVYPSIPTPIVSPQSTLESTITVIPLESATTVLPTTVVIPVTTTDKWMEESTVGMDTFPTPPSMTMESSVSPDPLFHSLDFLDLTPSTISPIRRKERPFDHLKEKLDKRVRFYDLRRAGEVRRAPPRVKLTKEEKEILASINVKEMEKINMKFPYELSSEWEPKKKWIPLGFNLFSSPKFSLTHSPLKEEKKKEDFSLKRILNFQVLPSPIESKLESMERKEIRRAPPKLPSIKDIERLEKLESGKGRSTRRPKIVVIRTRTQDESSHLPLQVFPHSFSHSPSILPPSQRVIVPHAVAPPRKDPSHPIPIHKDIPGGVNNCTAETDWCAALSMCLIEATSSERHAVNQMSPCQQNTFTLAKNLAVEYGECLLNESCSSFDDECHHPSSLPIISHCPSFFSDCSQLAACCPLTHRCSRLSATSPTAFSLDASCIICSQQ